MATFLLLLLCGVPVGVLLIVTAWRWEKFKRRGNNPALQCHVSDLLVGTFWLGTIAALVFSASLESENFWLFAILTLGSATAGLFIGKIFHLTSTTKSLGSAMAYLTVGLFSSLVLSFTPLIALGVLAERALRR